MKVVKLSDLYTDRLYPPSDTVVLISVKGWVVDPKIIAMKNSNPIGNRIQDLPASNVMPRPTRDPDWPRTFLIIITVSERTIQYTSKLNKNIKLCPYMFWSVTMTTIVKASVWKAYIHKVPLILCDYLQREFHKPYGSPTAVTWSHLLRKHTNTGTSTALTAKTHWSTRTRVRALFQRMTSA